MLTALRLGVYSLRLCTCSRIRAREDHMTEQGECELMHHQQSRSSAHAHPVSYHALTGIIAWGTRTAGPRNLPILSTCVVACHKKAGVKSFM